MNKEAMVKYLHLLKPKQLDYIVGRLRDKGHNEVHRGVLPFVSVRKVGVVLNMEILKLRQTNSPDEDGKQKSITGERFIREILDVIGGELRWVIPERGITSITMQLSDVKLSKRKKRLFGAKFQINYLGDPNQPLHLVKAGKNLWEVLAPTSIFDKATIWLAETFR